MIQILFNKIYITYIDMFINFVYIFSKNAKKNWKMRKMEETQQITQYIYKLITNRYDIYIDIYVYMILLFNSVFPFCIYKV